MAGAGVLGALLAAGFVPPARAQAAGRALFEATSLGEVLAALGAQDVTASGEIQLSLPDVAEDGRTVPVGMASRVPGTEQMVLVIEENPFLVAASVTFAEGVLAEVQTRVKMRRSTPVHVLARAGGRFYAARREVMVTVGGCGT